MPNVQLGKRRLRQNEREAGRLQALADGLAVEGLVGRLDDEIMRET